MKRFLAPICLVALSSPAVAATISCAVSSLNVTSQPIVFNLIHEGGDQVAEKTESLQIGNMAVALSISHAVRMDGNQYISLTAGLNNGEGMFASLSTEGLDPIIIKSKGANIKINCKQID